MGSARRALAIGINNYTVAPLAGPAKDAAAFAQRAQWNEDGSKNWATTVLIDEPVSEYDILQEERIDIQKLSDALTALFRNATDTDLLLYFAGHAVEQPWGSELLAADTRGVSFGDLMRMVNVTTASSVTIILDCCTSGDVANTAPVSRSASSVDQPQLFRIDRAELREGLSVLTSSRPSEPSFESNNHGLFTELLLSGLDGAAADMQGHISPLGLYSYVSEAFDAHQQRPLLKANMARPVVLRVSKPRVTPRDLRKLTTIFVTRDGPLRLSPEHEHPDAPKTTRQEDPHTPFQGTDEQVELDYLRLWRDAGLVVSDDGRDFYFNCIDSGTVSLTSTGRYFWDLAKRGAL